MWIQGNIYVRLLSDIRRWWSVYSTDRGGNAIEVKTSSRMFTTAARTRKSVNLIPSAK